MAPGPGAPLAVLVVLVVHQVAPAASVPRLALVARAVWVRVWAVSVASGAPAVSVVARVALLVAIRVREAFL